MKHNMAEAKITSIVWMLLSLQLSSSQISPTSNASIETSSSLPQSNMNEPTTSPNICTANCVCDLARRSVSCNNKGLTDIPSGIPNYVQFLSLNGNRFQDLPAFSFVDLPNLVSLQLVQCAIANIHPNAFAKLSQLRKLDLRSNLLENIPNGTFWGLTSMTELELQGNRIKHITSSAFQGLTLLNKVSLDGNLVSEFPIDLFNDNLNLEMLSLRFCKFDAIPSFESQLVNLKELDLSGNSITLIEGNSFQNLPSLRVLHLASMFPKLSNIDENAFLGLGELNVLDISDNALQTLSSTHIESLTSLQVLNLKNNPWFCNCQMGMLLQWLRQTSVDYFDPFWQCNSPATLQGQIVFTVSPIEKFACEPYVFIAPQNTAVEFEDPVVFTVSIEGDPTLIIQWYLPNGDLIGPEDGSSYEYVQAAGKVMVIQRAMEYHSGEYRVTAENSHGMTTIFFQVLVFNIPTTTLPTTTLMPLDTTVLPPPCIYTPIQVRVTDITDTSATLLWTAYNSPDLLGYIIHQNEFGNQNSYRTALTTSSETSKILQSLKPNSNFILCVTVYLKECPSFISLDQCAQIKTTGTPESSELEALRIKHRNELIILAAATMATTLLLVATIFLIFWRFKQPRSLRKYEFQATDDTVRFADLEPVDITAIGLDKRRSHTPLEKNGSVFTYDNPSKDIVEEHEYETPSEYPMKTFQAEIHKEPLPPDLPDHNEEDTLNFTHDPGLATLLSELRFQQDISDIDTDEEQ